MDKFARRPFLRWIQKTPKKQQALLVEPQKLIAEPDTPEGFYHTEMLVRSDLTKRFLVRGGKLEKRYGKA